VQDFGKIETTVRKEFHAAMAEHHLAKLGVEYMPVIVVGLQKLLHLFLYWSPRWTLNRQTRDTETHLSCGELNARKSQRQEQADQLEKVIDLGT